MLPVLPSQPRGSDPRDNERFRDDGKTVFLHAARDLSWLISRHYPLTPSLALVGDRHALDARSRLALQRFVVAAPDARARQVKLKSAATCDTLWIDGFNLIVTLEVAWSGGVLLESADEAVRDVAGLRGSYHPIAETHLALRALAAFLRATPVRTLHWFFDAPVSHAGDLAAIVRAWKVEHGFGGQVELVKDADSALLGCANVVSSDARVIDGAISWVSLAREVVESDCPEAWWITWKDVVCEGETTALR